MTDSAAFQTYVSDIRKRLLAGNATEHTYRPALQTLVESMEAGLQATNEPQRIACGAPDFIVTRGAAPIGYIEAKDIGAPLADVERSPQMKRYRASLSNLLLTDYLEFRWYVDGEPRAAARLAQLQADGALRTAPGGMAAAAQLLQHFLTQPAQAVNTPRDLAERMARLTHIIRDMILAAFETDQESDLLRGWRSAFAQVLIADMEQPERTAEFADMVAQTLAYGLFSARLMDPTPNTFSRQEAQKLIPKSNPFLRRFFAQMTSIELDEEPFAPFVNDLVTLLANTDMEAVLAQFGKRTRQEDPVVHFYETFLAAYDPRLRQMRGVYYTPEPVVSYIVRSVDALLKTHFGAPQGLADSTQISIPNYDPGVKVKGGKRTRKTLESHKVLILDPAAGTGTFLYAVIDHIRQQFISQGNAGMWSGYVKNHLLPRLFGFELLMAPYSVAHLKLSMQLAGRDLAAEVRPQWAYQPDEGERLGVYLTNTLEEVHEMTGLPLFTQWVADETNAANEVKQFLPVLVVLGNPPYSGHSANNGAWISGLLRGRLADGGKTESYYEVDGAPLGERNPKWLQDDYVKFIRWGQWRIARSGGGILAFVTNHGYLDNPTFRGMRQSLMATFSDIYLLDLHGNSKKQETAPDGGKDENVFDIQQGVAIGLFVKRPGAQGPARVQHADLWGTRPQKYAALFEEDVERTPWQPVEPQAPFYLFTPQDTALLGEYEKGWKVTEIFPINVLGFQTHRDHFAVACERDEMVRRMREMRETTLTDETFAQRYELRDNPSWQLARAREALRRDANWESHIIQCLYRPFDRRWCYFDAVAMDRPRRELKEHVVGRSSLCLLTSRQQATVGYRHAWVAREPANDCVISTTSREANQVMPLYLYPNTTQLFETFDWPAGKDGRRPNLTPAFVDECQARLHMTFVADSQGDLEETFGPEDIFHYAYAIFHAPSYRERYAQFLKIDFPRLPVTSDRALFRALAGLGAQLVGLHLLESPILNRPLTRFPAAGDSRVEQVRYQAPQPDDRGQPIPGRVYINRTQYVEGIAAEVWQLRVGGYQVLEKWLKDRKGRQLTFDDLVHYQQIVVALVETKRLMAEIDAAIPAWPMQ